MKSVIKFKCTQQKGLVMRQIIHNAIRTPDGTVLVSGSVHDYKTHKDKNGKTYMLDGGREYIRSSAHGDEVYLTMCSDEPHEKIREVFTWGTYGKMGDQPIRYVALKDLSDNHVAAILETQSHMPQYMRKLFEDEQGYRHEEASEIPPNSI